MAEPKDINETLRIYRHTQRISQQALSERTGISTAQISRIENGLKPRPDELARLVPVLTNKKA